MFLIAELEKQSYRPWKVGCLVEMNVPTALLETIACCDA